MDVPTDFQKNDRDQGYDRGEAKIGCGTFAKEQDADHDEDRVRQDSGVAYTIPIIEIYIDDHEDNDAKYQRGQSKVSLCIQPEKRNTNGRQTEERNHRAPGSKLNIEQSQRDGGTKDDPDNG